METPKGTSVCENTSFDVFIYYENRTQGTLKTIKKKKYNRLKSNSRYILH